ncbi:MAG: ABC transporter ATP-binding protein [Gammaproteobacteria bacterium]|nr:ABC transporter ATP-binding protein [Gammaproteobacteria bacterium]
MIHFDTVSKYFRNHQVLVDIELQLSVGDRIALVGSNGAGKTTLIRFLLGQYRGEGTVSVHGMQPHLQRRAVLSRFGFVPQLPPPLKMPTGHLLQYASRLYRCAMTPIEDVAVSLGINLGQVRGKPFDKLSGGQKQKILIAIALGHTSDLLIMDEPAANLDPTARAIFFQLLEERRDRCAMLISSHRLDEVAPLVNRVIEMDRGRIVLDDHVEDTLSQQSRWQCRLQLLHTDDAFASAITAWSFRAEGDGRTWKGVVTGADRLRFFGLLSRYSALLQWCNLQELEKQP